MKILKSWVIVGVSVCIVACAPPETGSEPTPGPNIMGPVGEVRPGLMEGFLHGQAPLNSAAFVPPPPAEGSPQEQADRAANQAVMPLRDTPRWELAASDANLRFPDAAVVFRCAASVEINETATPVTYRLLQRTLTDFGLATYPAKTTYQRARPFLVNEQPICTPDERDMLADDGSYPSGHSAIGWGWALVLSQLIPERAEAILSRGQAYVYSRQVCNVHWQSDTQAGMAVAAAAFARLQNDALYLATVAAAGDELQEVAGQPLPDGVCVWEAEALATEKPLAEALIDGESKSGLPG